MQEPRVGDCAEFGIAEKLRKGRGKKIIRDELECVLLEEKMKRWRELFFNSATALYPATRGTVWVPGTGYRVPVPAS